MSKFLFQWRRRHQVTGTSSNGQDLPVFAGKQNIPDLVSLHAELNVSFEEKGRLAAVAQLDAAIRQLEIDTLRQNFLNKVRMSLLYYEQEISKTDLFIEKMKKLGNDESTGRLIAHREMLANHLSLVRSLETDAQAGNGQTRRIDDTYNLGYMKGIVASVNLN